MKVIMTSLVLLITMHLTQLHAMQQWWNTHVACYFAQGGEPLSRAERKAALYSALLGYRYPEQSSQIPTHHGRYDVIFFSEESNETQNPHAYSILNRLRGLVLIN